MSSSGTGVSSRTRLTGVLCYPDGPPAGDGVRILEKGFFLISFSMALSSSSAGGIGLSGELIFCNIVAFVSRMRCEVDFVGPSTRSLNISTPLGLVLPPVFFSTFTE
eukprot:4100917-Pyramimonas_sp.AAC.1